MTKYLFVIFAGLIAIMVFALGLGSILKASDTNHARALYYPNVTPAEYAPDYSSPAIPDMQRLIWRTRHNYTDARDSLLEIYTHFFDPTHIVRSFEKRAFNAIAAKFETADPKFFAQIMDKCRSGQLDLIFCSELLPSQTIICRLPTPLQSYLIDPLPAIRQAARSMKWL